MTREQAPFPCRRGGASLALAMYRRKCSGTAPRVHVAKPGISMEEIEQFLSHDDVNMARRVYAPFSPNFLKEAAAVLGDDNLGASRVLATV